MECEVTAAYTHSSGNTSNVTKRDVLHANYMSTSSDTSRKTRVCGVPYRHGNFTFTAAAHTHTHIPPEADRMSQSATPATQNDMTTSSDTSRKTRFHSFSHRHGNFSLTMAAQTKTCLNTSNVTKCHACHTKRHDHIC